MLRVTEIFAAIQGETSYAGLPFSFVRLTGCNLRCRYCDTTYAYQGGEELPLEELAARVKIFRIPRLCVTGGEPLLQPEAHALVEAFLDKGYTVLVETNGTVPLGSLDARAVKIMDVKCPGSGEEGKTFWGNFAYLTPRDEVKFVVADRRDYEYAKEVLAARGEGRKFHVLFSPAFGVLDPSALAGWMIEDRLDARFQIQIHKIVWGPDRRGV